MVSQPIDLGRLVVSSGSIVFILFDTLIEVKIASRCPQFVFIFLLVGSK